MYRSDNDRSIKAQEYNVHKYYIYQTDIKLQYGRYKLEETNVRHIIYNAL